MRKLSSGYYVFFAMCAATLTTRAVLDSSFRNSTLLYLLIPFGISILLTLTVPPVEGDSPAQRYGRHMRIATIVMLGSSALLFEGFLCVLFFMPIYYIMVSIGFAFSSLADRDGGGHAGAYAIPVVVALLAAEGLTGPTTVPRYNEATYTQVLPGSIESLQANMARPIRFEARRHWFLWLFPMPTRIQAGTLRRGDVHRLHFVYKRWFFANIQQGDMAIRIAEVSPSRIRTEIVQNDSYLSHYMKIDGTEVRFRDVGGGRTQVSLTVKYHRLLDPAWYFGPMEQLAARQSARYLIDTIIARKDG
ncbi:MAG TPA: hypothetical protein VFQ67_01040 [Allosphingosinicella sp.]|jgi:hypothetical protein|nr:hypothetical protein [Allosphingosinicella sp.]